MAALLLCANICRKLTLTPCAFLLRTFIQAASFAPVRLFLLRAAVLDQLVGGYPERGRNDNERKNSEPIIVD